MSYFVVTVINKEPATAELVGGCFLGGVTGRVLRDLNLQPSASQHSETELKPPPSLRCISDWFPKTTIQRLIHSCKH